MRHRTQELRSIELHRLIAERLDEGLILRARARLYDWLADPGPERREYVQQWLDLLNGPRAALQAALVADTEQMRALRQCSPFAGALTDSERQQVFARIR